MDPTLMNQPSLGSPQPAPLVSPSVLPSKHPDESEHEEHEEVEQKPKAVTVAEALKLYNDAKKYIDTGFRTRWDNYFRVYSGHRVNQSYFGTISVSNREPHTIIETLVANIAGGNPKFHFIPTNENQNKETAVINGILDYYLQYNDMNIKNQIWVRDMLLYGTGVLHVAWREGKPWIENIAIRDFFFDPTSTGLVKTQSPARYAGFEYFAMKEDLRNTMIYDDNADKMVPKYSHLDDIGDVAQVDGDVRESDKKFKDMFNGSTLDDASVKQVHVILIYDLTSGKIMEIGNQKEFIYYEDSHLQMKEEKRPLKDEQGNDQLDAEGNVVQETKEGIKPFLPFAILRDYIDSSLFLGEGEMSVIFDDSELLNDYESMDADNASYQNTPMFTIDPQFADMAPEIETIAGAVYPLPKGALNPVELAQTGEGLEIKKAAIAERMRRETAADEAIQGVSQQQGRITATEVSTQIQQAQGRFTTKITNLATGGYAQLGLIILYMMQIFLTDKEAIRIIGKDGIEFKNFDPWEYNGEYEPQVELDSEIKQKQVEVGQKNAQIFQILQNSPIYDPVERDRYILQSMDPTLTDEKFNGLLSKAAPEPPSPKDFVQLDKMYPLVPVSTKIAILKMIGLPDDPQLEAELETEKIRTASTQADLLNPHTDTEGNPLPQLAPTPVTA